MQANSKRVREEASGVVRRRGSVTQRGLASRRAGWTNALLAALLCAGASAACSRAPDFDVIFGPPNGAKALVNSLLPSSMSSNVVRIRNTGRIPCNEATLVFDMQKVVRLEATEADTIYIDDANRTMNSSVIPPGALVTAVVSYPTNPAMIEIRCREGVWRSTSRW